MGSLICVAVVCALLTPGSFLQQMWRLKPEARIAFEKMGVWAIVLMGIVGSACAFSAVGLATRREWGRRLALGVLGVNLAGDVVNAAVSQDPRTLIGLPIGGAMIAYLLSRRVRGVFAGSGAERDGNDERSRSGRSDRPGAPPT